MCYAVVVFLTPLFHPECVGKKNLYVKSPENRVRVGQKKMRAYWCDCQLQIIFKHFSVVNLLHVDGENVTLRSMFDVHW